MTTPYEGGYYSIGGFFLTFTESIKNPTTIRKGNMPPSLE